ncbi:MAG: citrate synthase family protein [Acidobacteriota bacterium]
MGKPVFLTAREAAAELGVSVATIYAYVSRGRIRSELADNTRSRRYSRDDIESLKERHEQRRNPARVAEKALHWGAPVLESAISLIDDGQLYYRGHNVVTLAKERNVEQVAALIWTGDWIFPNSNSLNISHLWRTWQKSVASLSPMEKFQVFVSMAAPHDLSAYDLRPAAVAQTGARILRMLAAIAAGCMPSEEPITQVIQRSWASSDRKAIALINTALILSADHELNVSAFTARCVASAGSTPYAVVTAGLAALQGAKHGGYCDRVEALFNEAGNPSSARSCLVSRLRRGEEVPGFGHSLYPKGDPRGAILFKMVTRACPSNTAVKLAIAINTAMRNLTGEHPTIDFALVTLARALSLPQGAAIGLFALGRTIGWIGHAIEQYQTNRLIRPRARYIGITPTQNANKYENSTAAIKDKNR